jgi:prepilin-type N-terminal cleavage/methylation domain-containing protein
VSDDAANPASSDDKDFVHDLRHKGCGNPAALARNSPQQLPTIAGFFRQLLNGMAFSSLKGSGPTQIPTFFMKIQRPSSTLRRRSGFTLLEMVIVLGIIAMILGGAIFAMKGIGDAAKLRQVESDFKSFESALAMYKLNAGSFPTTQQGLKALVEKPSSTPVPPAAGRKS